MVTLGVDLASQPKHTAICLISWGDTSAHVEELWVGATDPDLHELFGRAAKIGMDTPFGWPVRFSRAVADYSTSMVWPSVDVSQLRFRRTDRVVWERLGRPPLSVSSDWIAVTAMRAARLLAERVAAGETIDRSGGGRFVETYPAAALSTWGFPSKGYKGPKKKAVRDRTCRWHCRDDQVMAHSHRRGSIPVWRVGRSAGCARGSSGRPGSGNRVLRIDSLRGSRSCRGGGMDCVAAVRQSRTTRVSSGSASGPGGARPGPVFPKPGVLADNA